MSDVTGSVPAFLSALRRLPLWMFIGLAVGAYAVLFVPPFAGVDPTSFRQAWGAWIWAGAITFSAVSIVGILDWGIAAFKSRVKARAARRILRFVPLDQERWWHLARQQDDSFVSQISLGCQVTNTTPSPVQIVRARLVRPRAKQVSAFVTLPLKGSQYHSSEHPIPGNGTVVASVHVMTRGVLGIQGRPVRVTIDITDQFGEEYRIKNLIINTHDALAPAPTIAERLRKVRSALGVAFGTKVQPVNAVLPPMPWTYEPGAEYLKICEAILSEEKRSYAARGRSSGKLGSLNVGLQSEPNYGWTKEGEIPQLLWKKEDATPLSSSNLDRLLKIRSALAPQEADNLDRFLLNQLRRDSAFVEVAYFVVLALHRMNRTIDALMTARTYLSRDKVYGYSNVLGMLSAVVSHEHFQISEELYQQISNVVSADAEHDFRLKEKINLARVQRLDQGI